MFLIDYLFIVANFRNIISKSAFLIELQVTPIRFLTSNNKNKTRSENVLYGIFDSKKKIFYYIKFIIKFITLIKSRKSHQAKKGIMVE